MTGRNVLVSAAVAAICAAILVLFTDIELALVRWVSCSPLAPQASERAGVCRERR